MKPQLCHRSLLMEGFFLPVADKPPVCPLVAFDELTRGGSRLYVRQCTALHPHPLPLIAGSLEILREGNNTEDELDGEEGPELEDDYENDDKGVILHVDRCMAFSLSFPFLLFSLLPTCIH